MTDPIPVPREVLERARDYLRNEAAHEHWSGNRCPNRVPLDECNFANCAEPRFMADELDALLSAPAPEVFTPEWFARPIRQPPATEPQHIEFTPEWCANAATSEAGGEVIAGAPPPPPPTEVRPLSPEGHAAFGAVVAKRSQKMPTPAEVREKCAKVADAKAARYGRDADVCAESKNFNSANRLRVGQGVAASLASEIRALPLTTGEEG